MNISIRDYFENNYTPAMQDVLFKVINLFYRLNITTYEAFVLNILNSTEEIDASFTSINITNYLDGFIRNLEKEFGFQLGDDITLEQRVDFVRGYVDLEDYIDHTSVIRILETDSLDVEKLAEAVSLTTEYSFETLITFVISVEETALITLKRIHLNETPLKELADETEDFVADEQQVNQVKAYNFFILEQNFKVNSLQLIRDGYKIGMPFNVYWAKVKDEVLTLDRNQFCIEMIALFLLSKEHWVNPQIAFSSVCEEWFDSLTTMTENNNVIKTLMNSFINYKIKNRIK